MKKRILLIILGWIVEIVALLRWNNCWHFKDTFYFTKDTLSNVLINAINADTNTPLFVVRLFHNKVTAFLWGLLQTFLQYWDIRFFSELLGIVGAIGIYLAIWYLVTKRQKTWWAWGLVAIYSVFALWEMIVIPHFPYFYRVIFFAVISQVLSIFGWWIFLQKKGKLRIGLFIALLILSAFALWLLPQSYLSMCLHV